MIALEFSSIISLIVSLLYHFYSFRASSEGVDERKDIHIADWTLIPLDQFPSRLNELPKNPEIVVIGGTAHRGAQGCDTLLNAGFAQVTSMTVGLTVESGWSSNSKRAITSL